MKNASRSPARGCSALIPPLAFHSIKSPPL
jgi:hypothetical protein